MVERNGAVLECFGGGTVTASRIHYAMPRGFVAGALCWLAVSLFERCTRSVHKVLREDRLEVLVLFVRIHRLFPEVPSEKKKHNDECRDRVGKLLMNKGAQRVESYFERARVREEKEKQQRVQDPRQSWRMHRHQRVKHMLKRLRRTHSQRRGRCAFFRVQKYFFGIQKTKVIFWIQKSFFFGILNVFFGIQKNVIDIFGGQRGLINCFIVLDILEVKSGKEVGDPKSSRKSSRKQQRTKQEKQQKEAEEKKQNTAAQTNRAAKTTESTHNKPHKQKQVIQTTKSTKQQQTKKKAPKGSAKSSKRSSKKQHKHEKQNSSTTSSKAAQTTAKVAQTAQTATKTAKAATETGPRRRGTKGLFVFSLSFSCGISVFPGFFEISVNLIIIGYLFFA